MQQDAFRDLSGDRNPLHTDAEYARRTPFGHEVVYGMALVLAALGQWARGRPFHLRRIEAEFRKPLLVETACELAIEQLEAGPFEAHWIRGESTVHARIRWEGQLVSALPPVEQADGAAPEGAFVRVESRPRGEVLPASGRLATYPYSLRGRALDRLTAFGLRSSQIEAAALQAICGSSFLAGMELPGEPALLVDFSCELDERATPKAGEVFVFRDLEWTHDCRFGTVGVLGHGTGLSAVRVTARSRPEPVHVSLEEIESAVGRSTRLQNETVFVTGAARGFGSVIARALALHGAVVIANARVPSAQAADMIREMDHAGLRGRLSTGDVGDADAMRTQADALVSGGVTLTGLVLNAYPPIRPERFCDWAPGELDREVLAGIRMTTVPLRALLPALGPGGWAISISSVYVAEPRAGFSAYIASKAAVEHLFRTVAVEFPRHRFAVFRAPRMRTDQTNVGVSPASSESAADAAAHLLERLGDPRAAAPGYEQWTFRGL